MTEVLLADHRLLVQYGLQALLQDLPDLTLVDAVGDCGQLSRLCRQLKPTVVLLNINLPELQLDPLLTQLASDAAETHVLLLLDPGQEAQIDLHKLLQHGGGEAQFYQTNQTNCCSTRCVQWAKVRSGLVHVCSSC